MDFMSKRLRGDEDDEDKDPSIPPRSTLIAPGGRRKFCVFETASQGVFHSHDYKGPYETMFLQTRGRVFVNLEHFAEVSLDFGPAFLTDEKGEYCDTRQGLSEFGVLVYCSEIKYSSSSTRLLWQATAGMIVTGTFSMGIAIVFTILSIYRSKHLRTARWAAFVASIIYSVASLVFPVGFRADVIGGEAYKLPQYTQVGYSYVLFVVSLLLVFIGELFAMKILCAQ